MKSIYKFVCLFSITLAFISCTLNDKGAKTEQSLTEDERTALIEQKRASYYGHNSDSLLFGNKIKLSVLEPVVQGEDITEDISRRIATKMLQIVGQNGISGIGTNPTFVIGVEIVQTEKTTTATAPQKMAIKYEMTFKVMNVITGDVFGTTVQNVSGVGMSFQDATQNAVNQIRNTSNMQSFLQKTSDRIIEWYDTNLDSIKKMVDSAVSKGDFEYALAIVEAVPEQANVVFEWAKNKQPELYEQFRHKVAADNYAAMQRAVAVADNEFDPSIGGYFQLIPTDVPEYAKAQKLYDSYLEKVKARRSALEAKAEQEASAKLQWEKEKAKMTHETELQRIEAEKAKCKYEQMASSKAMERAMRAANDDKHRGFFGRLGSRIIDGIDHLTGKDKEDIDDWK